MRLFWLLLISFLPGLLWVYFFYRKDKYEPEPKRLVLLAFFYGALVVIPVGIIEMPFAPLISQPPNLMVLLLLTIGVIGLVEEFGKFAVIRYTIYNSSEFNEVMDGIVYSIAAGLGFAAFENLLYAYVFGYQVGLIRAIITSLIHASFSGIMGYYLGRAKCEGKPNLIYIGLIQVILLHGIYDFLVIGGMLPNYGVFLLVALFYIYLAQLIKMALLASPFR
ncbi:PrsW family intramembrane metalloprotease [Halonatronum saccharophilum]|uniref:PrsW family intramembrane metalloprotease n=1 Tax=Halonatronum saccharophilum TaxID=150060 RepID=UPI000485983F|nr:PrsW family glutamic-type intramembrane protease [Halonatronum saccharophilum]